MMRISGKFGGLLFVLCCGMLWGSHRLLGQCAAAVDQKSSLKALVDVSLDKDSVGEAPLVTFKITNVGSVPFYIPKTVDDVDFRGGFQAAVTGPPGAKWKSTVGIADNFNYIDVAKEIGESWILLWPCDFYGGTRRLTTVPLSAGTYMIVARRNPPRLAQDLKQHLHNVLKFPVLLDAVESRPIQFRLSEGNKIEIP